MKITLFTSNQPRHLALIEALAGIADRVYAVQECNTVFPGKVADFFRKSEVMQRYFERVMKAEAEVFGRPRFGPANVVQMALKMGDLNLLEAEALGPAMESDVYVVFGASYIKGWLCEELVARRALNIHMGVSPYYRGSSCNFWAMYDGRADLVGATIHLLSAGLDSGPMLAHAFAEAEAADPFVIGMKSVRAAHVAVVEGIANGRLLQARPVVQDRTLEIRYTRNADFTDAVAEEYLSRLPGPVEVYEGMKRREGNRGL